MSQERPYSQKSTDDLEIKSQYYWHNPDILKLISAELEFRYGENARVLARKIAGRIGELEESENSLNYSGLSAYSNLNNNQDNSLIGLEYAEGILGYFGYKVGADGVSENQRRQILKRVFTEDLPSIKSIEYMQEWGNPGSEKRYQKMVDSISNRMRSVKQLDDRKNYAQVIKDWETDLHYLHSIYTSTKTTNYYQLYLQTKAKNVELISKIDELENQIYNLEETADKSASLINQLQQDLEKAIQEIQVYQEEVSRLENLAVLNYQKYQEEVSKLENLAVLNYQKYIEERTQSQANLLLYQNELGDLSSQCDRLQQLFAKSQADTYKLIMFQEQLKQEHGIQTTELNEKITANNYLFQQEQAKSQELTNQVNLTLEKLQAYEKEVQALTDILTHERKKYQEIFSRYEQEKQEKNELIAKSTISTFPEWQKWNQTENDILKQEITQEITNIIGQLQASDTSKEEIINYLDNLAKRIDIKTEKAINTEINQNSVDIWQKFQNIWIAVKKNITE